ncbi:hypothetical protein DFH07DRAFT_531336 [Mycena maculata]|uniref:Uncharacterized protein n=1 Tax=Mycena maculata TaxID=230809 RepID=A0AAD7IYD9_9AGAR|nr:hypothetical protein DFH07DRAFT_531336 [Mycena maculata]
MDTRKLGQSATVFEMDDPPYTAAEDDPFNIKPLLLQPRRRRSSMLNKWIQDQQQPTQVVDVDDEPLPHSGTRSNPYLAYPELGTPTFNAGFNASAVSFNSYDLLEDDDIPPESEMPSTPIPTPSRRGSKLLGTPSSFRSFHIPFLSTSPAGSVATSSGTAQRTPTRGLFFPRAPRSSTDSAHGQHTRSSSLSTLNILGENNSLPPSSTAKSRWRPSVLGHFGMSASQPSVVPSDTLHTRSRPSISSNNTYTTTTMTDGDIPATPPQSLAAESVRARSRSYGSMLKLVDNASTFSVWSGPSYLDELGEFSRSPLRATSTMSCDGYIGMPPRVPLGPKPGSRLAASNRDPEPAANRPMKQDNLPEVAYSAENKTRTLPRVSFASLGTRAKRKKKLIISGIAAGDTRKFEAAKRWCESFGEVSQITRMPNDDLHVHFRNADVADTVCRLRAKVYIRGVGSVQLSWYTGNGSENSR